MHVYNFTFPPTHSLFLIRAMRHVASFRRWEADGKHWLVARKHDRQKREDNIAWQPLDSFEKTYWTKNKRQYGKILIGDLVV